MALGSTGVLGRQGVSTNHFIFQKSFPTKSFPLSFNFQVDYNVSPPGLGDRYILDMSIPGEAGSLAKEASYTFSKPDLWHYLH